MYRPILPRISSLLLVLGMIAVLAFAVPRPVLAQVDLNSASLAELAAVDGISDTMARKIVSSRPLRSKRDLVDRLGMTESVYGRVKDQVVARGGTGSGSGSGSGTGSGSGSDFGHGSGTGTSGGDTSYGSGTGTGGGRTSGTGSGSGGYNTGTNSGSGGYNTGTGSGSGSGTGSGSGSVTGQTGTGDGNVYRENYRTGRSNLRSGNYQDSIERLLEARRLADQYGNRQEVYEIDADLASAYLWRGIELYKDATWANDYDAAISYLEKANVRITQDDLWMSALGGTSLAIRKLNLKNYYLGMCYFEKGAYFDWVDNDGLAKLYLSQVVKSREQWGYFSDPKMLAEQKILFADAKYTLGQLFEKSRDTQYSAQSYKEAYQAYKQLQATGMGELFYYWGEGTGSVSYNQLYFSNRRKKRQSMAEKMASMEVSLVSLANKAVNSSNYGEARDYADFVFTNSRNHETRSAALDVTIQSYEKANNYQRAIDLRRQYRNDFGYHKHTIGMAKGYRALGDNGQAKRLYQEVAQSSGADNRYVVEASNGMADLTLPEIDDQIRAGNLQGAVSSIKSFLDSYPATTQKDDFTRRVGDVVDKYVANGQGDAAIKLIDEFSARYASGSGAAMLEAKKVGILEKRGDFAAYKNAVQAFDAKYSRVSPDTANALLARLVENWEKRDSAGADAAQIQALVNTLAQRGNSFGTARHQQAAQAELARVKGLGDKAQIRAGLLHMAAFPDSRYSTAKAVIDAAREAYLAQYASPWYYDSHQKLKASPESARGVFGGVKDEKAQKKHDMWANVAKKVSEREVNTYGRYEAAALARIFDPASEASKAYKAMTDRIDKELAAFNAWQDAGFFKKSGFKKTYEALVASRPTLQDLENTFLAKAYSPAAGGTGSGTTRREGSPTFDGVR